VARHPPVAQRRTLEPNTAYKSNLVAQDMFLELDIVLIQHSVSASHQSNFHVSASIII
ncbi:unnamed protein product, partial [Musa acuminata var. zebrina]